jgi:hypothetical protein
MKFSFQTLLFIGRSYGKISAGGAIFISPTVDPDKGDQSITDPAGPEH